MPNIEQPITDYEELVNTCVLGFGLWLADIENMKVHLFSNPRIVQGFAGKRVFSDTKDAVYIGWCGIEDPTFNSAMSYPGVNHLFHTQQAAQNWVNLALVRTKPYES